MYKKFMQRFGVRASEEITWENIMLIYSTISQMFVEQHDESSGLYCWAYTEDFYQVYLGIFGDVDDIFKRADLEDLERCCYSFAKEFTKRFP